METDVLVVGAGPGGSAAAYHLARQGIDVTVLERSAFPREKVCGDGITPRGVAAMLRMGVDTAEPGYERVLGLRVYSRSATIELPWPELRSWPDYGLVRTRHDFDAILASRAQKAGARLVERTEAVQPIVTDGWVTGARIRGTEEPGEPGSEVRARFVIAADGAASRFAKPAGIRRDVSRPLGIAARRYYRVEHRPGPWFESWLDLWEGDLLLPGYGWLFPLADGTVNLGAGLLNTFRGFKEVSAQRLFDAFSTMLPQAWGISEDTAAGRVLSGPLPMSFNRIPVAVPGLLLVGDAAGAVNPFNGEGIAYAMETAEMAAEVIGEALVRGRPGIAASYPGMLRDRYEAYFRIGRGFARAIGKPAIMGRATKHLLPRPAVMHFAMRMMANLTDGRDGDAQDRLFWLLERLAGIL
ncbi:MAG: geranylgeranyl reductase family protein [Actinobacteria bacterium]|nr:geranylgeranyl reductase family protein [Actinomycetota bacterium]